MAKVREIPKLSAEKFSYELYESNFWARIGLQFSTDDDLIIATAAKQAVGYCDANRLLVRPKDRMVAIMCEDDDGEKFWFHHYKTAFEARGVLKFKEEEE